MYTPWGKSDYMEKVVRGIIWYGTPSHGGLHVSPKVNAQIHKAWRHADGWYEEDLAWAIVAFHFPNLFPNYLPALSILMDWYPDEYMQVTGEALSDKDSHKLMERKRRESME